MRKATAPHADRFDWGLLPSIEAYKLKLRVLESRCREISRNFSEIEKSCWPGGQVLIAQNSRELAEKICMRKPENISLEDFKKNALAGTPDECVEQLQVYVDLGVTYFMLFFADLPSLEGLRVFAENVMGKVTVRGRL
jgi:alkanesulfonate monooxygenase SsuD/methylene tetrahydromethanopterin reductase-like flavin-dependent oxidoreductase (luciferase family)